MCGYGLSNWRNRRLSRQPQRAGKARYAPTYEPHQEYLFMSSHMVSPSYFSVFPDPVDPTYQAVFRASAVVVEGELEMKATKTVDGNPNYFIRMFRDISFSFTPADNNENVCGGPCDIGTRGITVAGGKLTSKFAV